MNAPRDADRMLDLLFALGAAIRASVIEARAAATSTADLAGIAAVTASDVIYRVDKVSEDAILNWFAAHWPPAWPVELVMEGVDEHGAVTFPAGTPVGATQWKCIIDPIDGTRNLMYDKRSAWALAALAPQRGPANHLGDIVVAAMIELPTSKAWRSDEIGAVRGRGPGGVVARAIDLRAGGSQPLELHPSRAIDFEHGFASVVKFFPEGKALSAEIEEALWSGLRKTQDAPMPAVFDDQYLSTGGQIYELLAGHDRMIADLRPLILPHVGARNALACHPYDICTALILQEAGGLVEDPSGGPLRAPLDTTTPVAWVGFANSTVAGLARPILQTILREKGLT